MLVQARSRITSCCSTWWLARSFISWFCVILNSPFFNSNARARSRLFIRNVFFIVDEFTTKHHSNHYCYFTSIIILTIPLTVNVSTKLKTKSLWQIVNLKTAQKNRERCKNIHLILPMSRNGNLHKFIHSSTLRSTYFIKLISLVLTIFAFIMPFTGKYIISIRYTAAFFSRFFIHNSLQHATPT